MKVAYDVSQESLDGVYFLYYCLGNKMESQDDNSFD
jgi:hypothetical protein